MNNLKGKLIAALLAFVAFMAFSVNSPAEGASVSVASQISTLQKQVSQLQAAINLINSKPPAEFKTANIAYYTLSNGCREPGTAIVAIPITATILCGMEVLVPSN